MTTPSTPFSSDDWIQHCAFLRALARRLVGCDREAEDLVQQTWVATLEHRPEGIADRRGWLARVLGNFVRMHRRDAGRRARRDLAMLEAKPGHVPATDEVAATLEVQRHVAEAATDLPEPYRTAVYLRFYEGRETRQIAGELGLPVETVRTRLKRAMALLRGQLDQRCGSRERWGALLYPLATSKEVLVTTKAVGVLAGMTAWIVMSKTKLMFAGLAAILIVGTYASWPGAAEAPDTDSSTRPEPIVPSEPRTDPGAEMRDPVKAPAEATSTRAEQKSVTVELRGRITIVDGDRRRLSLSGTFVLLTRIDGAWKPRDVTLAGGYFRVAVKPRQKLYFSSLEVDGKPAATVRDSYDIPANHYLEVDARRLQAVRLHVIDGETRRPLSDVEVRRPTWWRGYSDELHPGDHQRVKSIVKGANSPIALPRLKGRAVYWAHAPGYAWARIVILHDQTGQRTVELLKGGDLTVQITGDEIPEDCFIRLHTHITERPPLDIADFAGIQKWRAAQGFKRFCVLEVHANRHGPTRVRDMRAGSYVVYVETGDWDSRRKLGEAIVAIGPDTSGVVTVRIENTKLERASVRGSVTVPDGLTKSPFSIRIAQEGRQEPHQKWVYIPRKKMVRKGAPGRFEFDAGELLPGRYWLFISPVLIRQRFEVELGRDNEIEVRVPALAEIAVTIKDTKTGAIIIPDRVNWSGPPIKGLKGEISSRATIDRNTGHVSFVAVEGEVRMTVEHKDYLRASDVTRRTTAGANHFVVLMEKGCGLKVTVRHKGALLPMGNQFWGRIELEQPSGAPQWTQSSSTEHFSIWHFKQPGKYSIRFPKVDGYQAVPPRTVKLGEGVTEVVFDLVAEKPGQPR